MNRLSSAVVVLVSLAAGLANAVPVTITAEGQVLGSRDDFNLFGLGTGFDTIIGATITQVYTFDTDDIPTTDVNSLTWSATYRDGTNWVSATTFVDTSTVDSSLDASILSGPDRIFDQLQVADGDLISRTSELVALQVLSTGVAFESFRQRIEFSDHNTVTDNIRSLDPIAALDLLNPALWQNAQGFALYSTFSQVTSTIYSISSVDVAYATVPEPSALGLMGVGLFALGFMRKRRC